MLTELGQEVSCSYVHAPSVVGRYLGSEIPLLKLFVIWNKENDSVFLSYICLVQCDVFLLSSSYTNCKKGRRD